MRVLPASLLLTAVFTFAAPALAHDRHDDDARHRPNNWHDDRARDTDRNHGGYDSQRRDSRHDDRKHGRPAQRERFHPHDRDVVVNWYGYRSRPHDYGYRPAPRYRVAYLPPVVYTQLRPYYGQRFSAYEVPADLAFRLGPAPHGFTRIIIGPDLLLIHLGSGRVVDRIRW